MSCSFIEDIGNLLRNLVFMPLNLQLIYGVSDILDISVTNKDRESYSAAFQSSEKML